MADTALAQRLEAIFERDMRECTEPELAFWKRRGAGHKQLDRGCQRLKEQL